MILWLLACGPKAAAPPKVGVVAAPVQNDAPDTSNEEPPAPTWWRSGALLAEDVAGTPTPRWSITLGGPVTEPILADDDRIWVVADGAVVCLDLAGGKRWTAKIGAKTAAERTPEGIAVGTDTSIVWLDPNTGAVRKQEAVATPARYQPLSLPDGLWWTTQDGGVRTVGHAYTRLLNVAGRIAGDGARIFATSLGGDVVAIEGDSAVWTAQLGAPAVAGPSFDGELLVVPFAAQDRVPGGVVAYSRDGVERWRWQSRFGPGAALAIDDVVYVADKDGMVHGLDRGDGHERWAAEGYGAFSTTPVLVGRSVYVGNGDGSLYRIDRDDGGVAWKIDLGAAVTGDPTVVGGLIVSGLANGRVVALGG